MKIGSRANLARQLSFFSASGFISLGADMATLTIATRTFGFNLYAARAVSFLVAASVAWALNRMLTFAEGKSASRMREWFRFIGFNAVGGAANFGTYAWIVHDIRALRDQPLIAVAC